ncbi:MAG: ATP-binding cassette domain-containing protein [Gammaproteobacteria bacterium]|nr:ATP-binding cassette domain-containing protein [Gammaproteobacteria bacterium]
MGNQVAIRAEGLSKLFRIGSKEKKADDSLAALAFGLLRNPVNNFRKYRSLYQFSDVSFDQRKNLEKDPADVIWALRDVSFEVRQGEVLGVIGRNGAGKSTLLKILTRITPPTTGRVDIMGRVSSLLEVGTGFHQELTGRENIYLNGTILGMRKREVDNKFDEIVEFSGIERFLDTPVKRYSSGMTVRLAFAVAAHLEPEILIVDEVLAVGDAAFQKKCILKMQEVGRHGRTILFVSHNMAAVSMLCTRAILLGDGRVEMSGSAHDIVSEYLNAGVGLPSSREWPLETAPGGEVARLRGIRVVTREGRLVDSTDIRRDVGVQMDYDVIQGGQTLMPHYLFYNEEGVLLFEAHDQDRTWRRRVRPEGSYRSTAWIPGNFLNSGTVFVTCALMESNPDMHQYYEQQVIAFNVTDRIGEDTARGDWTGELGGVVRPMLKWETRVEGVSQERGLYTVL